MKAAAQALLARLAHRESSLQCSALACFGHHFSPYRARNAAGERPSAARTSIDAPGPGQSPNGESGLHFAGPPGAVGFLR